eukprot:TRINITY_DN12331_c0_g1_i1.p1 TRINITY_DN12331_c0_g1~~TRINITY_DN12331_c0_g1_i1.p1  ORF type:complete len:187 (+),score=14.61 TRINITY_DN12331_c0_g1_i1:52-612(+)
MINSVHQDEPNYMFQECIGEGQIGKAYRAILAMSEGAPSQEVVVKVYSDDEGGRFRNEIELMERVNGQPNVVKILASYSQGTKSIVMRYYGEYDLHQHVWQCDGISEFKAAGVTRDLLSALQHIHGCGILHRDVKPENLILGQDGKTVLLDFDLSCYASDTLATQTQSGSPGFLAPEVIQGKRCSF